MQKPYYSICNFLLLRFFSNNFGSGLGFQLEYKSSNFTHWSYNSGSCGGNFTTQNGILTSPSYPGNYPANADCIYIISQPNATCVTISFLSMDVSRKGTYTDFIEMRDGNSENSPLMGRFSGNGSNIPQSLMSTQNKLRIR